MQGKPILNIATPSNPLEKIVQQQQAALVGRDIDLYCAPLDPGIEFADAGLNNVIYGIPSVHSVVKQMMNNITLACDWVKFTVQKFYTVRPTGPLFGKTPPLARVAMESTLLFHKMDNTEVLLPGVDMFEFGYDSKIVRLTSFYDPRVLGQLGKGHEQS